MEEVGRVVELSGENAIVEFEDTEKCRHCGAQSICHQGPGGKMQTKAINEIGAAVGDRVKVALSPGMSVFIAFLLFVVPIIAFIIAFAIVRALTKSENFAIIGGFGGLIAFFLLLIRINQQAARRKEFKPIIKEIIDRAEELFLDPVCGMKISKSEAPAGLKYGDKVYYFCSLACKKAFEENPESYIGQ